MSGPPTEPPAVTDAYSQFFPSNLPVNTPSVGAARTQLGDAWHDYMYALNKRNPRQVNRIRVYGSQLMGAVR